MAAAMTKRELVDRVMGGRLVDYVRTRRDADPRKSWDRIAGDLRDDYRIEVAGETLRLWVGDPDDADQAAS
jgi:hypothetical protein